MNIGEESFSDLISKSFFRLNYSSEKNSHNCTWETAQFTCFLLLLFVPNGHAVKVKVSVGHQLSKWIQSLLAGSWGETQVSEQSVSQLVFCSHEIVCILLYRSKYLLSCWKLSIKWKGHVAGIVLKIVMKLWIYCS